MSELTPNTRRDEDIIRLSPMEHVRKRPGMYIGGTDSTALHHMIYETVNQSIDLAFVGQCDHIWVTLRANNEVCIRDNGPGHSPIVDKHGRSQLEIFMTEIGMCGRHIPEAREYYVSGGLHGVGITAINGLSEWMSVKVARDGYLWRQDYRAGIPQSPVEQIRPLDAEVETGMAFTFLPDFSIFQPNYFSYKQLANRFQEISYLIKGLSITLRDERINPPIEAVFHSEAGIVDYIKQINADVVSLHEPIYERFEVSISRQHYAPYTIEVEFVLQYTETTVCKLISFVNTIEVTDDGDYVRAIKSSITEVINSKLHYRFDDQADEYSQQEVTGGLTVIIHLLHPNPSFESATQVRLLVVPELYGAISEAVFRAANRLLSDSGTLIRLSEKLEDNRFVLQGGVC